LKPTEAVQTDVIGKLDDGTSLLPTDELVRSNPESFKDVVEQAITRLRQPGRKLQRLYLMCDAADEADALALRPALAQAGFEVDMPEFGEGGVVPREESERCSRECDAVLMFWGRATETQMRKRLDDLEASVTGPRGGRRYSVRGLYVAPPSSERKKTFVSQLVDVMVRDPGQLGQLRPLQP
jgi:hypothetical protein